MKKYGVKNNRLLIKCYACCKFKYMVDEDDLFGTDDLNEAFRFIAHCDTPLHMEVFEKENCK